MVAALGAVITRMRERIGATDEPDPVTQDILIGLYRRAREARLDVPGGERRLSVRLRAVRGRTGRGPPPAVAGGLVVPGAGD